MSVVYRFLMVTAVVGALWWGSARGRFPGALAVLSLVSLGLAAVTLLAEGLHWQLVPWQVLATACAAAATLRWWWTANGGPRRYWAPVRCDCPSMREIAHEPALMGNGISTSRSQKGSAPSDAFDPCDMKGTPWTPRSRRMRSA